VVGDVLEDISALIIRAMMMEAVSSFETIMSVSLERRSVSTTIHGATSQKAATFTHFLQFSGLSLLPVDVLQTLKLPGWGKYHIISIEIVFEINFIS
jgi:hypothetical protein